MSDKNLPEFWRSIKQGDIITLTDIRTLDVARKQSQGVAGLDYAVKSVHRLVEAEGLAEWRLLELDCPHDSRELRLVAKIVDQELSLGTMEPLGLAPGTREELLEQEMFFLFQAPPDEDDFDPSELSYEKFIENDDGYGWFQKPQGELLAEIDSIPEDSGTDGVVATVVEYGDRSWRASENDDWTEKDNKDEPDEVYIIEKGIDEENTYVEFFGMWALGPADVDVLRQ